MVKQAIIDLLGPQSYQGDTLHAHYIAQKIFEDKALLQKMNALVHPEVGKDFEQWRAAQTAPYVIKEAAILFENGSYKSCDFMIVVIAPIATRIERVVKRDKTTEEAVIQRIKSQWNDAKKVALSDVYIENVFLDETQKTVLRVHKHLLLKIKKGW